MKDTMFLPPRALRPRIAPTESCTPLRWPCEGAETQMLRGVVHDPTARRMGGVAGHAGLFSTAADLAIFCRMLLDGGVYHGARMLSPLAVAKMTSPDDRRRSATCAASAGTSIRRTRRIAASCCRSGRSGTPASPARRCGSIRRPGMFVVFLSNRVHPDGKGDVTPLRARVATVAASAILDRAACARRQRRGPDATSARPARCRRRRRASRS